MASEIKYTGTNEELIVIVTNFNKFITELMVFLQQKEQGNMDIHLLNTMVRECRELDFTLLLDKCQDKIWNSHKYILAEDEKWFLENKFSEYIKKDKREAMIYNLIDILKNGWKTLYEKEKKLVWKKVRGMLDEVINYQLWKRVTKIPLPDPKRQMPD